MMKKIIMFLIMLMFVFSITNVFATENIGESSSGEAIYLESYEQYQELLNSMSGGDDAKNGYTEQLINTIIYDTPAQTYKATVLNASEVKSEFAGDANDGYNLYVYQEISLEIMEGKYAGQTFTQCAYPLKVDFFYNIKMKEVKAGDTIYVCMYEDDETVYPYISYVDSVFSRSGLIIFLFVIALSMILIYTGKHGAKILVPIILLVDLLFIVFAEFILNYIGVWATIVGIILLVSVSFFTIRLGVNSKLVTAMISLVAILSVMTMMIYGFDAITNISGLSYEASKLVEKIYPTIEENVISSTLDFHALSVGITILLMAVVLIPIIVKSMEVLEDNTIESNEELKKYLAEKILFVLGILMVMLVQKSMYIYLNAGRVEQILNSEMLAIEVSRILFMVIAMTLSVTITEMVSKFLEDK